MTIDEPLPALDVLLINAISFTRPTQREPSNHAEYTTNLTYPSRGSPSGGLPTPLRVRVAAVTALSFGSLGQIVIWQCVGRRLGEARAPNWHLYDALADVRRHIRLSLMSHA